MERALPIKVGARVLQHAAADGYLAHVRPGGRWRVIALTQRSWITAHREHRGETAACEMGAKRLLSVDQDVPPPAPFNDWSLKNNVMFLSCIAITV